MSAAAEIVAAAVGSRYTAAVLRVECGGRVRFERAFGTLDDGAAAAACEATTSFDLASLTKLFVATAALSLVARDALALDDPLTAFFPEWRATDHAPITLRDLLAHRAGMASGADFHTLFARDVEVFARTHALVAPVRERVVYSDLGFITLGTLVARAGGASLATVVARTLHENGCTQTRFRPRNDGARFVPATEFDAWRGRVRGAVHDEKAYLCNGVAGHAGLFGTACDVARLAETYLAAANGRKRAGLDASLAREAIAEHAPDPVLRRGLGWALKTSDENSCGARMSRATFGHTGFTGTVVWADPERDLSVVLLTNAVYYGRNDLRDLRAAVCDAVVAEYAR